MPSLGQLTFVLHRPRSLDNVGAAARVVKNFGIGGLSLVDPLSFAFERARKLGVGAEDVLERMFVHRDLRTALAPMTVVIGTSSRSLRRRPSVGPMELGRRFAGLAAPWAVLFGDEKRGLSDEELELCQEVCRIPTEPDQPSLNLAQACAVIGFALHEGGSVEEPPPVEAPASPPASAPASQEEQWAARAEAHRALAECGFLNPEQPELVLGELTRSWGRARLSRREVELWRNAFRKLADELARRRR
ncbi:MAG: RNA methyltransferase [Deltaproteobacteria bacterium]